MASTYPTTPSEPFLYIDKKGCKMFQMTVVDLKYPINNIVNVSVQVPFVFLLWSLLYMYLLIYTYIGLFAFL